MNLQRLGYTSIASHLRIRINSGSYEPGILLPSESALCREFDVKRTAVRRAFSLLEREGLIITIPAKGRMVRGGLCSTPHLYQQIARDLREQIRAGELTEECLIPSEANLRRRYSASRNTVRRAMSELEAEGLIIARHGSGRYVRGG
ncbi:GntR family transcriptional regulator [Nonomuraea typhae]|uniref:GntR family transcriptional regulator n=1 Tax=Nonomuraea typhae TaxID=2603600 RepID=UPI0012F7449E|nr:GntR family transcriptional regulator [Nonomuraea typhae]